MPDHTQQRATRSIRRVVAALCTVVMIAGLAGPTLADEFDAQLPSENATSHPVVDLLFLRPLGFVALIGGVSLFVPAAAITLVTRPQEIDEPFSWLVAGPARYVWADGLGEH
jgi:hypothetical protein